ncbi:MAG: response regulator [Rhodospirillales bacterium]|nr:response regulator [Rhodospirillales bacterium]
MPYHLDDVKVLIVDDMQPMLTLTKSVLSTFGFLRIFTAQSGEEAFNLFCKHDPDVVITDWIMEPMDGLEFTKKIRTDPRSPNPYVPVIMMTGFSSKLRVESARDNGITEFLVKPFTAQDLYARIFQIVEKPRKFVDTGQFFGPDRRRKSAKGYEGPRRRDDDPSKAAPNAPPETLDILKKLSEEAKKI